MNKEDALKLLEQYSITTEVGEDEFTLDDAIRHLSSLGTHPSSVRTVQRRLSELKFAGKLTSRYAVKNGVKVTAWKWVSQEIPPSGQSQESSQKTGGQSRTRRKPTSS